MTSGKQAVTWLGSFHHRLYRAVNSQLSTEIDRQERQGNPRETKTRSSAAEITEFEGITKRTAYEKVRP